MALVAALVAVPVVAALVAVAVVAVETVVVDFTCTGPVIEWRGPAPFWFLAIPEEDSQDLKEAARGLEYWGQVAVAVRIGQTDFTTALFPKDGRYLLPLKVAVRQAASIEPGDMVTAELTLTERRMP